MFRVKKYLRHGGGGDGEKDSLANSLTGRTASTSSSSSNNTVLRTPPMVSEDEEVASKPVSLWSDDLAAVRKDVFIRHIITTFALGIVVMALLSLYWGALSRVQKNIHNLTVWVVDFDGRVPPYDSGEPFVGPFITKLVDEQNASLRPHLNYVFKAPSYFGNSTRAVWEGIYNQHAWAAIIVNANATTLLHQAVQQGNSSYDPKGVAQLVYVQARDDSTINTYVVPEIQKFMAEALAKFGRTWLAEILPQSNTTDFARNLERAPQAFNPAIGYSSYNIRPFDSSMATPTVTIGLIFLLVVSFFASTFFMPISGRFMHGDKTPKVRQWLIWRVVGSLFTYFILSLFYSLVSLAFKVPFSRQPAPPHETAHASAYGKGTFPVFWMLNFVAMVALGIASENAIMVVGAPYFSLWLIFWIISNVSTGFYAIPLSPRFYRFGYAWPLRNIVEATRTIVFDTHSRIGLNFGVLFIWCAVNLALFPSCALFRLWRMKRNKMKEAAGRISK